MIVLIINSSIIDIETSTDLKYIIINEVTNDVRQLAELHKDLISRNTFQFVKIGLIYQAYFLLRPITQSIIDEFWIELKF